MRKGRYLRKIVNGSISRKSSFCIDIGKESCERVLRLYSNMATSRLPPIDTIPSLPTEDRAAILDLLFEPSPQLLTLSLPLLQSQSFTSYPDLIASVGTQLSALADSASSSDTAWLNDILSSHPRLGAKKVDSAQSAAEQAKLQEGGSEEAEKLRVLNEEYERTFPGLRYVVFVNGRGRGEIMEDMKRRIEGGSLNGEREGCIRVGHVGL